MRSWQRRWPSTCKTTLARKPAWRTGCIQPCACCSNCGPQARTSQNKDVRDRPYVAVDHQARKEVRFFHPDMMTAVKMKVKLLEVDDGPARYSEKEVLDRIDLQVDVIHEIQMSGVRKPSASWTWSSTAAALSGTTAGPTRRAYRQILQSQSQTTLSQAKARNKERHSEGADRLRGLLSPVADEIDVWGSQLVAIWPRSYWSKPTSVS